MMRDEEHLKLLSIFHYVVGGLAGLVSLFPVIHLVVGLFFVFAPGKLEGQGGPPPTAFGWLFVMMAAAFIVAGFVIAGLMVMTGRFLAKRRHYLFCLVIAGVECLFMPFGTALGIFTIIVLVRDSVKQLFLTNGRA
jgi:hypothetical protein